jgi:hypothetical protein
MCASRVPCDHTRTFLIFLSFFAMLERRNNILDNALVSVINAAHPWAVVLSLTNIVDVFEVRRDDELIIHSYLGIPAPTDLAKQACKLFSLSSTEQDPTQPLTCKHHVLRGTRQEEHKVQPYSLFLIDSSTTLDGKISSNTF